MTVKTKKRGRPTADKPALSMEKILEQAKMLMQREGKIPSIRRLASSLEVDAMAIYYYFTNKAELLESITVSLVEDIYEPYTQIQRSSWRLELQRLCESYLGLLQQYPGLLETLLSMESLGPAQIFTQRFEQVISPLALSQQDKDNAISLLADYLHGYALALNCQKAGATLTLEHLKGPLELYCTGLEVKSDESD
ncbi:TetR/AcrR family transcriptional regulator [Vibrio maerlii]|uniref:TetR/AcrR family transcriptional regulator n=1 Tax=Vibrio maerlii TaxID=2231648 RepID=UPI000E3DB8ED|nr:TetR/AcrR family transcriptional regulator [Vibrio maerlii]